MAYTFMEINKIKTCGNMVSKYNHNYRKVDVANAIPGLEGLNEELIPLPVKDDGTEMRYDEAFRERIGSLPYYQDHRVRGNQVLGYELLMTFSKDESVDVETWKKQSVEWLHKTFDVAGDGKSNVLGAIYHADESGNVHIHAFVVPIDERGHLNAKRFTDGSRRMSDLQSSYAETVACAGLERGLHGSSAKHQVIRKLYADINNVSSIPEPKENETAAEYRQRIQGEAEEMYLARVNAANTHANNVRREADRYRIAQSEAASDEMEHMRRMYAEDIKGKKEEKSRLQEKIDAEKKELDAYQAQVDTLTRQMWEIRTTMKVTEEKIENGIKMARIEAGLELIRTEDPERAANIEGEIDYAIERAAAMEMENQDRDLIEMDL